MSYGLGECFNVGSNDVNYIPLPLYHSNGGAVGIGMTLLRGNASAIRKKFSASKFFEDCQKCGATVSSFQLQIKELKIPFTEIEPGQYLKLDNLCF